MECCLEGIRSNRYSAALASLLENAFMVSGDLEGAIQFWKQALSHNPFDSCLRKRLNAAKSKNEWALKFLRRSKGVENSGNSVQLVL
jgi:hypothetical protein